MMKLAVAGENGRMARALLALIEQDAQFSLINTISRGEGVPDAAQAILDFTTPDTSVALAEIAAQRSLIHVIGTTGFTPEQDERIARAAQKAVIVKSGNMSLGVNLLLSLVQDAASRLPASFDIEILETHHRNKVDAPSGTALMLGAAAKQGRAHLANSPIGYKSLRIGSVIGEHDVIFAGSCERIVLSHKAEDRTVFARGALVAALWAQGKKPGLYSMQDVLEIKS